MDAAGTSAATLPRPRRVSAAETRRLAPVLGPGVRGGILAFDGQLEDDARLVATIARTAAGRGAVVRTRARALELHGRGAVLRDEPTGAVHEVRARAVVNATGDVLAEDGSILAGPRDDHGETLSSAGILAGVEGPPAWAEAEADRQGTTLVAVLTDAGLNKTGCAKVARMASAGIARAIDPAFTPFDGDIVFCLAAGEEAPSPWLVARIGTVAATVVAAAIRDGIRQAA